MIDWLEEVLRGAQSEEERIWLSELLRQGTVPAMQPAVQKTEESIGREEHLLQDTEHPEFRQTEESSFREGKTSALAELVRKATGQVFLPSGGVSAGGGFDGMAVGRLYRLTSEAMQSRRAAETPRAPSVIREEQTVHTGLTARELDRAVRRDSRRYDGGMNIY